jgi:peptidoglycan/xylan/chitin deacetylase (PgdA/CDA1 family)
MIDKILNIKCRIIDKIFFRNSNQIPVLMYHSIGESGSRLAIGARQFEEQVEYLAGQGYETINPLEIGESGAKKPIIITFDDGFKDNFQIAHPIMEKFGFKGAIFVSTDYIGGLSHFCRIEADKKHLMLSEKEIKNLHGAGWVIANHFASHSDLVDMDTDSIASDFKKAKEMLEKITGYSESASIVSYPHSMLNSKVIEAVKNAGALMAFNGKNYAYDPEKDDKFVIPRIGIIDTVGMDKFKLLLSPTFNWLKKWK